MINNTPISVISKNTLLGVFVLGGLYLTSLYSYLLFHSIAELFGVVIAFGIFVVAWNARSFVKNNYLLFMGIAYLFVAFLDLLHTLSYKGMGVFHGYGSNLPTQLWIISRYLESISLFIAPIILIRKMRTDLVFSVFAAVTFSLLGSIFFWNIFPVCFIEGTGLTPFKKISEYVISLILLSSIFMLYRRKKDFDPSVYRLLVASILITILSELAFTFYIHVYGLSNLAGHFLKLISFYLIYKAIIENSLMKPYDSLFRDLKQNEQSLLIKNYAIESSINPTALFDNNSNLTYVNPAFLRLWGYYNEREVFGKSVLDFFENKKITTDIIKILSINGRWTGELVATKKDSTSFNVQVSASIVKDKSGKPVCMLASFIDITERKKAEKERSHLLQRLEAQWTIARMGDTDEKTVSNLVLSEIIKISESKYGFYGFINEDEEILTIHSWSKEAMNDCRIQEKPVQFSIEKSGAWGNAIRERKAVIINNYDKGDYPNKKGLPKGHVSINRMLAVPIFRYDRIVAMGAVANKETDYTRQDIEQINVFLRSAQIIQDKRKAEEELKKHREHLMELVEERTHELRSSYEKLEKVAIERRHAEEQARLMAMFTELNPSPVLRFDINGRILMANASAVERFDIDLRKNTLLTSFLPDMEILDPADCIRKGRVLSHISQYGSRFFHFTITGIPEINAGHLYGSDITEQKKAEAETMRTRHLASLGELAAGVAHEINNPINGIINYAQILANKTDQESKEHDIAMRIQKESDRIAGIIKSLLSFARDSKEEKHNVSIREILADLLSICSTHLKKDGINLQMDISPDIPAVIAHPQQIEQVFMNVISNARYSLNQKCPGMNKDKVLKISAKNVDIDGLPFVQISFHDKGTGIPEEIIDNVLNPFFTTKPKNIGTGLGLSISHGIIDDHGGNITVKSVEGEFTELNITLPSYNGRSKK